MTPPHTLLGVCGGHNYPGLTQHFLGQKSQVVTLPSHQAYGFWSQAKERWKATSPCHALWLGWTGFNQVPPMTQPRACQASGNHYGDWVQGREMEEREAKLFISWGERHIWGGKGGEEQAHLKGLLAIRVWGDARTIAMGQVLVHGSEVVKGPVLMSVVPVATESHADLSCQHCHLGPVSYRPGLSLRAMSLSLALPYSGSVLTSTTSDNIEDHATPRGPGHHLEPCWSARAALPWEVERMRFWVACATIWVYGDIWARLPHRTMCGSEFLP